MWVVRPLPLAVAFAAGIAVAPVLDRVGIDEPWRWAVAAAAGLAAIAARRHVVIRVLVVALIGTAWGARAPRPIAGVTVDDRGLDRVVGVIRGPVEHGPRGVGARLDGDGGAVWVWSNEPLVAGEQVAITGLVHTPRGLLDPATPDRTDVVAARGADYEMTAQAIERLGDDPSPIDRAWRWAAETQAAWVETIDAAGGDPDGAAALRGIVTGDRGEVPDALDRRWRATGIYHVLSVSGLHLAVVAGLAFSVLRRLIAASPWGGRCRPARWAAPPALVLAIAYTMITGAQLATLRSLVGVGLMLAAAMLDRPLRLIDALGLAALAILAWRPADVFDPSFQLSFTAALTLALRPPGTRRGLAGWITRGIATSFWVALTTAPITALHFQQVAAGGVIGNLVLTPAVELIALPLALVGLAADAAGLSLGALLIRAAAWLVGLVDRGAGLLATVTPVGRIAVASAITAAILVALAVWLASRARRTRGSVIAWLAMCIVWSFARTPPPLGALRVTFLDVGQGDGALVELPDGAVWIVDAGGAASAADLATASAPGRTLQRVLTAYGHDRVDLAVISHPHPDHYLGLFALDVPVRELWSARELEPPQLPRSALPAFTDVVAALAARGTRFVQPPLGLARAEAGVELVVWAPSYQAEADGPVVETSDPVRSVNDNSLVIAVRYRGRTIVFAGDLEAEGEAALVAAGLPAVDVVKVAHHGSPTSSTEPFVAATRPALAVISCGRGNHFGFPSPAVVARWRAVGAEVARTDLQGAITVTVDASGELAIETVAGGFTSTAP